MGISPGVKNAGSAVAKPSRAGAGEKRWQRKTASVLGPGEVAARAAALKTGGRSGRGSGDRGEGRERSRAAPAAAAPTTGAGRATGGGLSPLLPESCIPPPPPLTSRADIGIAHLALGAPAPPARLRSAPFRSSPDRAREGVWRCRPPPGAAPAPAPRRPPPQDGGQPGGTGSPWRAARAAPGRERRRADDGPPRPSHHPRRGPPASAGKEAAKPGEAELSGGWRRAGVRVYLAARREPGTGGRGGDGRGRTDKDGPRQRVAKRGKERAPLTSRSPAAVLRDLQATETGGVFTVLDRHPTTKKNKQKKTTKGEGKRKGKLSPDVVLSTYFFPGWKSHPGS